MQTEEPPGSVIEKRREANATRSLKHVLVGVFLASALLLSLIEVAFLSVADMSPGLFSLKTAVIVGMEAVVLLAAYLVVRWATGRHLPAAGGEKLEMAFIVDEIEDPELAERVMCALGECELRYWSVFDLSGDAMMVHSLDGLFVEVNKEACDRLGYTREEFLKLTPSDIDAGHAETGPGRIQELREKGRFTFETTLVARDGKELPTEITDIIVRSAGQELVMSIARDITVRKRAEEALRTSEQRYRMLVENACDVILTTDLGLNVTYASPSLERETGYTAEEVIGRDTREFVTPQSFEALSGVLADQLARQSETDVTPPAPVTAEVEQICKDGSTYTGEIRAGFLRDTVGTPYGVIVVSRNISEKRETEEALRKGEEMFRDVFEDSPLLMGIFDRESRLVRMNKAALKVFGELYLEGEQGYRLFEDIGLEDEKKNSLRSGETVKYEREVCLEHLSAERGIPEPIETGIRFFRVFITPFGLKEESLPFGYLVQGQDITDQKWAELEVSRLSRRVVDEYEEARRKIAIDLHDEFGQSVTALKIEVDMLQREAGDRLEDQQERLDGMVALLEDTLDKIRTISGELRPVLLDDFGLEKALRLYLGEFSSKTGIVVKVDCSAVPASLGKSTELAVFRIAQEGLVNIARHAKATEVNVTLLCEDGTIVLTVTDNGQGFDMDRAFRGYSAHSPFGILGMRERAAMVGGELDLSSRIGKGTTVSARVPIEPAV